MVKNSPNMETLNWDDPTEVRYAKKYFDKCVHAMNSHNQHQRNIQVRLNVYDHPSVKDTEQIFQSDIMIDYE